jgi:hypothetical protein
MVMGITSSARWLSGSSRRLGRRDLAVVEWRTWPTSRSIRIALQVEDPALL